MLQIFGPLSGLLNIAAYAPYIIDTLHGRTKPQRTTWLVFSIMAVGSFFSLASLGAQQSLWLAGAQSLAVITISILSIKRGVGGFSKLDLLVLLASLSGLALWWLFGVPEYSLYINIAVGFMALVPTIIKAMKHPDTETTSTWVLGTLAGIAALVAASTSKPSIIAYPLYIIVANGIVMALLLSQRNK